MARPITLFTGQWADLPLEDMCRKASDFGYQGIELACWGDHFEVNKAVADPNYCSAKRDLLDRYDLQCHAISSHLVGQAVCDRIDERHKAILPPHVWGDGDPAGVNRRAAEEMKNTARAAQQLGVGVVNGFTGSSIWPLLVFVPAGAQFDDRRGLQAVRRSLESDPGRVRRVRRAVRARSASDGDRVRHRDGPPGARCDRQPRGVRLQLRPEPPALAGHRPGRVHPRVPGPHLPRAHQGRDRHAQRPQRHSGAAISTSATRVAAGTSARRAAAA